jgi:hypothetical protein
VQPRVARIPHDRQEPRPHIAALVSVEKTEGAEARFLRHVLRIMIVPRQPAREVVRSVQMGQDGLLETVTSRYFRHLRVSRRSSLADL